MMGGRKFFVPTMMAFGFAFLYVPILSMMLFSFNYSKLVTVWDAANSPTLKWYGLLFKNDQIMMTNAVICLSDRKRAREIALELGRGYQYTMVATRKLGLL